VRRSMQAFVLTGPRAGAVQEVLRPEPEPGWVVVDVARVGLCGTDVEFFTGEMAYLAQGHAGYPMRPGHEWCGVVAALGEGVDPGWLGERVTGDTMIGCGACERCHSGRHNVCATRREIGIRGGLAGALAEQLAVPATALLRLPDTVDDVAGALVESGGNAVRAVRAADLHAGDRLLVFGTGTIGLLVAQFARAGGAEVVVVGTSAAGLEFARTLGFRGAEPSDLPAARWDAVVDATNAAEVPALALKLVEPGKRVVYIGLAGSPSRIDTRDLVLRDVTAVGILAASQGLSDTVAQYAAHAVDPRPLVAATVALDQVADVLGGRRPAGAGPGPKIHVDPHR
jgi:2-desacetyl-2-hydroxyethyl bacteriochlorophyllide A dehydrogenase